MKTKRNLIQIWLLCAAMLQAVTSGAQPVTKIAGGGQHSLFLMNDGSLWAMGYNYYGQLGDGNYYSDSSDWPEQIVTNGVTAIAAGELHSLFLKSDGSLWAMGYGGDGELGGGGYYSTAWPAQIVSSNVTTIAAGSYHSLFLKSDGSLWAMGYNYDGELGDGTYNETNQPEQIVASNVTAIAAGSYHSLFLKSDGSLWAMGDNNYGQLGGSYDYTNRPEQIVSSNVMAIAAGGDHSLFLKSDGSLWAMGYNYDGELGDGTTTSRYKPVKIVSSNVTAIAAGYSHSLFLKSDGSLWAMGYNYDGELGDGTYNDTNRPEQIVSSNVTAIAAGESHSLFVKSDGSLWAMGDNNKGQLGDGTYYDYTGNAPYSNNTNQPEQIVSSPIFNDGFEMANFLGWTGSGNFSFCFVKNNYVHSGRYGAQLGPVGSLGFLSQTLPTTAGASYLLSFWLDSPDGETPNEFLVSWNGNTLLDMTNLTAIGWTNIQFVVTATGTNAVLQFGFRDDSSFLGLDDISLVSVVPGQPSIVGISLSGINLVVNGAKGLSGRTYYVLMSTNVAQPLSQWTPIATNVLGASGDFTITATNAVTPNVLQGYYILQLQ